jgi:hypothetical protein
MYAESPHFGGHITNDPKLDPPGGFCVYLSEHVFLRVKPQINKVFVSSFPMNLFQMRKDRLPPSAAAHFSVFGEAAETIVQASARYKMSLKYPSCSAEHHVRS